LELLLIPPPSPLGIGPLITRRGLPVVDLVVRIVLVVDLVVGIVLRCLDKGFKKNGVDGGLGGAELGRDLHANTKVLVFVGRMDVDFLKQNGGRDLQETLNETGKNHARRST
jgi:hypothetical protein